MPFNGSGSFSPLYSFVNDANNGIKILASRQDQQWTDVCTNGLSDCMTRDGQSPATANIPMGTFKIINLGNGTVATDGAAFGQIQAAQGALVGFIGGLILSAAGSTGTFGIAPGAASDSTATGLISLASAFTKTTADFVAGTGNGALDMGSIANTTWYHVFIIGDPALPGDILFSLSATSPTLPTGYTLFRRIGSMLTDSSSHWVAFTQVGNYFRWKTFIADYQNVPGVTTAVTQTLTVPTGIIVQPDLMFAINSGSSGGAGSQLAILTALNETDTAPSSVYWQVVVNNVNNAYGSSTDVTSLWTNTSAQIRRRVSGTDAALSIFTNGWMDLRGSQ